MRLKSVLSFFTDNVSTLFRASTLATMLMDQLMKLTAMDYLHSVLKTTVQKIAELKDSCEVNRPCCKCDMYIIYYTTCRTCIA